ncbi:MAG TPA: sulfite exporter TauE/SafE family protein [Candidatus Limnocylindrales bacterium]|nr:sulfite exporter TauE/SafE family protein [Candidatus Limnocylindrales bacterium]
MTLLDVLALLGIGLTAGLLAGLLGIGGGVVMVPAMVLIMGMDQHIAQGTSLLVIIPAAVLGSFTHHRHGRLALRDAAALAVGGVLGAVLGSVTALSLDDELLQRLFAVLILIVAVRLLTTRRSAPKPTDPATT